MTCNPPPGRTYRLPPQLLKIITNAESPAELLAALAGDPRLPRTGREPRDCAAATTRGECSVTGTPVTADPAALTALAGGDMVALSGMRTTGLSVPLTRPPVVSGARSAAGAAGAASLAAALAAAAALLL
jgi:hypothetical protein